MSSNLFCVSTHNGSVLLSKRRGDNTEDIPYSTIASFYSVSLFCKSQNVDITTTRCREGEIITWKDFENFCFIASSNHLSEKILMLLVENVFNAMIMHCGMNEIKNLTNVDRFKRDLTSNFHQMVDKLMDLAENDSFEYNENFLLSQEIQNVNQKLRIFSDQIGLQYCSIIVKNKIVCATEAFENLCEKKLINLLLTTNLMQKREIPIYLPILSPFLAYRLVNLPLIKDVTIAIICGKSPALTDIDALSQAYWQNSYDDLILCTTPKVQILDPIIIGYLLVNTTTKKYVISNQATNRKQTHRIQTLLAFFHQFENLIECFEDDPVMINELYFISDYHKCHVSFKEENILCVLYTNIPTYSMSFCSRELYSRIQNEIKIFW